MRLVCSRVSWRRGCQPCALAEQLLPVGSLRVLIPVRGRVDSIATARLQAVDELES
jgi:hypothetical protein